MAANTSRSIWFPRSFPAFSFTDVKPASELDFSKAAHLAAHTFDGLEYSHGCGSGERRGLGADFRPAATGHARHAEAGSGEINARAADWAYKLATERGQFFSMTRDNLFAKAQAHMAMVNRASR